MGVVWVFLIKQEDMSKKYKYKREHFENQWQFECFRDMRCKAQKRWLKNKELSDPEYRERRLIRQRLYSRYHYHTDCRKEFSLWLLENYCIECFKTTSLDYLRKIAGKS